MHQRLCHQNATYVHFVTGWWCWDECLLLWIQHHAHVDEMWQPCLPGSHYLWSPCDSAVSWTSKTWKKDNFFQLTWREGERQPWYLAVGRGVWRTSHSWDKLVVCLNKSGLKAGFSLRCAKGPKKIRYLTRLYHIQIRLPQNQISSVEYPYDKSVSKPGLKSSRNSSSPASSGKCTPP